MSPSAESVAPAATVIPSALEAGLVLDPMDAPALRWGILGAGFIASVLAEAVTRRTASTIAAVGSRGVEKAQEFINKNLGERSEAVAYGSYEELVAAPDLDVIYIATPHSHHREHGLLAINAGKHVLVEKSFARNAAEAREILDAAAAQGVFVMEAMWTRFLPHIAAVRDVISQGLIGEVSTIMADHGYRFPYDPNHRVFNLNLAGGALLDLGVYPVSFAHDLLGVPQQVHAHGSLTSDGVDGQISMTLTYADDAQAHLHTSIVGSTPGSGTIVGSLGRIDLAASFYRPNSFTVSTYDGQEFVYETDAEVLGFEFQAAEVARQIAAGATASDRMPWQGTLEVMEIMDSIRAQVGVVYPGE